MFAKSLLGLILVYGLASDRVIAQEAKPKLAELEEKLFELQGDGDEFFGLLRKAKESGLPKQVDLELRFLYFAENENEEGIAGLASELRTAAAQFDPETSRIFSTKEAFLAVVFYAEALKALGEGDHEEFEKAIKEAFWNSPAQAGVFADPIDRLRTFEAMKQVDVDMDLLFKMQVGDQNTSLNKLVGKGKGVILHFWSPWHRECEISVPEMAKVAGSLAELGLASAMVLPEQGEAQLEEAARLRRTSAKAPVSWLLDRQKDSLAVPLRVDRLPMTVVLDPQGKVLFHGDTGSDEMWEALHSIDPGVEVPRQQPEPEEVETP